MEILFDAVGATFMVFASLAGASLLCWSTWESCFRLGFPQGSGLIIGNIAMAGLFIVPHGSVLTLMLAYAAAGAFPIWMAGKVSFKRAALVAAPLAIRA